MEKSNVLIFVPHEDDELNIAGPVISMLKQQYNCFFVFMTNGDYGISAEIRVCEAIRSLSVYKISKENMIFLGYPDQYAGENTHFYIDCEAYAKKFQRRYTVGTRYKDEFCFQVNGYHEELTKENLIKDIMQLIEMYKPLVIISVDYDTHPDHRVLAMAADEAIGRVLKRNWEYAPYVLKTYAYETMYEGKADYSAINLPVACYADDKICNPFLEWEDRIRIPVNNGNCFLFNKLFWAYAQHVSQMAIVRVNRTINSDHVFWLRRTDNVLRRCINCEPGIDKLWDFCLFGTNDIMKLKPLPEAELDKSYFYELLPYQTLYLNLDKEYSIEYLTVYVINEYRSNDKGLMQILINDENFNFDIDRKFTKKYIAVNKDGVNQVAITNRSDGALLLAEIEAFEVKPNEIQKIFIESNGTVSSRVYFDSDLIIYKVNCIEKYGRKKCLTTDEYDIIITSGSKNINVDEDKIMIKNGAVSFSLKIILKSDSQISCETKFIRRTKRIYLYCKIVKIANFLIHNLIGELSKYRQKRLRRRHNKSYQ